MYPGRATCIRIQVDRLHVTVTTIFFRRYRIHVDGDRRYRWVEVDTTCVRATCIRCKRGITLCVYLQATSTMSTKSYEPLSGRSGSGQVQSCLTRLFRRPAVSPLHTPLAFHMYTACIVGGRLLDATLKPGFHYPS